jgi:hypothetical protein
LEGLLFGVTVIVKPKEMYFDMKNKMYQSNKEEEIVIAEIKANEVVTLFKDIDRKFVNNIEPSLLEQFILVLERIKIMLFYHIG